MDVLIVESAAKARTLKRYLGEGWSVLATGGHVQTLPHDRRAHGKAASNAFWANRPGELPDPPWVWTDRGEAAVREILEKSDSDDPTFWIATDPDREGEFIAWCLERLLQPHGPTHRVSFQEVTEEAVRAALEHPRPVDRTMVESALVRKFLDRLVGYRTSKMARAIVPGPGASMGRVQTPTLGFVVERELEREAHVPIPYFEVHAAAAGVDLHVRFHEPRDPDAWRNEAGSYHSARTFDGELAEEAFEGLRQAGSVTVEELTHGTSDRSPAAPLSTDAVLQVAGSRFNWSPQKTSALASMLYEAGHITYIRTDSTRLAESAVQKARAVVGDVYGEDHLGPAGRTAVATGPVQDAHEAIRPTRLEVEDPPDVEDGDARKLYRLVRAHTLASQMAPSRRATVRIDASAAGVERPLRGNLSWRTFAGWEAAYAEFMEDPATAPPDIPLEKGAAWPLDPATDGDPNPRLVEDETKPPSRYRPHTLIRAMKEAGIGRPSTYSRTIEKLEERAYVELEESTLVPTERGRAVWLEAAPLYARNGEGGGASVELFSTDFTALMERRLDAIAEGRIPAPSTWEEWRDQIRELHDEARARRDAGASTLDQQERIERFLGSPGAGQVVEDPEALRPLSDLSYQDARDLLARFREAGVEPVPTERQMDYLRQLDTELALEPDEREELIGVRDLPQITSSRRASAAIEELKRVHEERRPASEKQRRYIEDLLERAEMTAEEGAALVGVGSLDELTGGQEGSASALIDRLRERLGEEP